MIGDWPCDIATYSWYKEVCSTTCGYCGPTTTEPISEATPSLCKCGIANTRNGGNDYIVDGEPTEENEYPWQVGLYGLDCGGSLISDRTVLTAAHCLHGKCHCRPGGDCRCSTTAGILRVIVGMHRWDGSEHDGTEVLARKIIIHEDYVAPGFIQPGRVMHDNDLALIILSRPIRWSRSVAPICLPTLGSQLYEGRMATVTGWGLLAAGDMVKSTVLRKGHVKVISNKKCGQMWAHQEWLQGITENMLCAAEKNGLGGKDACTGDSGGPLITERQGGEKQFEQIGVVSFGEGCGEKEYPGVYARVTAQLDWIKREMEGETCS